jgi:hypothetical protein
MPSGVASIAALTDAVSVVRAASIQTGLPKNA